MNRRQARHTITLNDSAFSRLRNEGHFGESYSEVILRVLDQLMEIKKEGKNEDD